MIFTDLGLVDKKFYNSTKQVDIQVVGKAPDHGWLYWNKGLVQCRADPSTDPILVKPS